jgi:HlyD family secretion protein
MSGSVSGLSGLTRPGADPVNPFTIAPPRRRWVTRAAVPAVILAGFAGVLLYAGGGALRRPTPVLVAPVVMKAGGAAIAGQITTQAPGWIEADPYVVNVAALADGAVQEVLVLEGQPVQAGQVVARLIDEDARLAYQRATAEHAMHQAALNEVLVELQAAQRVWDNPVELKRAVAASLAAEQEARAEVARVDAEIASETATLATIRDEFERTSRLSQSSAAAEGELSRITLRLRAQEAVVEAARARRPVQEARVRQAEAESLAARENLELRIEDKRRVEMGKALLKRAEAEYNAGEAALYEAKLRLDRMEIKSPVAGIVQARLIEVGSRVMTSGNNPADAYVLRVYDPAKLQARVDIPLTDAAKVHVGDRAEVLTEALPDRVFSGRVTRLVHEANIQKNTVQVKVALEGPAEELRPEMLVRARFFAAPPPASAGQPAAEGPPRLFVPTAAISSEGSTPMAWIVNQKRMAAEMRRLRLGPTDGQYTLVLEGLNPGDRVILEPLAVLSEGSKVRISGEAAERSRP